MLTLNLNILWTVVNILVLFVLLRKFLYRPVMNVIEQRQKQIDDAIADAEGKKNDAQAVLAQAQDKPVSYTHVTVPTNREVGVLKSRRWLETNTQVQQTKGGHE